MSPGSPAATANPTQFEVTRDPAGRSVYRHMFQWFTFTAVIAAFACTIAVEDLIRLMAAPVFHGAADVVPLLVVTYVLAGIHLFFNAALLIKKRTGLVALIGLRERGRQCGAGAVLPYFLASGAAVARAVGMIVMARRRIKRFEGRKRARGILNRHRGAAG